jgi:hypothetical protein
MFSKRRLLNISLLLTAILIISTLAMAAEPLCHITITTRSSSGAWPSSIYKGQSVYDSATILPDSTGLLQGNLTFYACGPSASITPCSSGGATVSTIALSENVVSGKAITKNSGSFTPTQTGVYCFRVVFTRTGGVFPSLTHVGGNSTTQNECVNVIDNPTAVTLSSFSGTPSDSDNAALWLGFGGLLVIGIGGLCLANKK